MSTLKIAVCYMVHDDTYYLAQSIASFQEAGDTFVFVSQTPWHDQPGDWEATAELARHTGATVVYGEWRSEVEHRQAVLQHLRDNGFTHSFLPDGDEIIEPTLLLALQKLILWR